MANISYEEELVIFKKLEKRKVELEKMKQDRFSSFDILVYGLYLTQLKRQAGGATLDDKTLLTKIEVDLELITVFKNK